MKTLAAILSGQTTSRVHLIAAGLFIAVWFIMDLTEWLSWAFGRSCG